MKIAIDNKIIQIDEETLKLANTLTQKYISSVKESCLSKGQLMLYVAFLVTMHANTGQLLNHLDEDTVNTIYEIYKKQTNINHLDE